MENQGKSRWTPGLKKFHRQWWRSKAAVLYYRRQIGRVTNLAEDRCLSRREYVEWKQRKRQWTWGGMRGKREFLLWLEEWKRRHPPQ